MQFHVLFYIYCCNFFYAYLFYIVDAGCRGVIFDRFQGVKQNVYGEGTHFLIPVIQKPIIFDCKARPRNIPVITGSKGTVCDNDEVLFKLCCITKTNLVSMIQHEVASIALKCE